ncbi:MAG: hypothetical protein DRI54_04670 [Bacteroidetes bacterium]|nr:MAG: hypothetical protein DRI54_04670 [Bacteroidota bacterium]
MRIIICIKPKILIFVLAGMFLFPVVLLSQEDQKQDSTVVSKIDSISVNSKQDSTVISNKQARKEAKKQKQQSKKAAKDSLSVTKASADTSQVKQSANNNPKVVKLVTAKDTVNQFQQDTSVADHRELSPLDIQSDRGIFILSHDHLLQLRILGSVRVMFNYNDRDLLSKTAFNPYEISTGSNVSSPNFYAGVSRSRLGFEITRRTKKAGDVFVRLEMDFGGNNNTSFRIRHAYGQFSHLIVGQTWSLFNNVVFAPPIVNNGGPVGSSTQRTTQIRYYRSINKKLKWAAGIEYSSPDLNIPDSVIGTLVQVIPDFTGRVRRVDDQFSWQASAVITTISGKDSTNQLSYAFGFGINLGAKLVFKKHHHLYISFITGNSIAHFINIFNGKGEDADYNPATNNFEGNFSTSGYAAYERKLPYDLSASLAFGIAAITNQPFQLDNAFDYAYNVLLDAFWSPIPGARLGFEYAFGQRFDLDNSRGLANRVSVLMYYDF